MAKVLVRGGRPCDDFSRIVIQATNGDEKSDPLLKLSSSNDHAGFLKKAFADAKQPVFQVTNPADRNALCFLTIAIISEITDANARTNAVKKFVTSEDCRKLCAGFESSVLHMLFHVLMGIDDFISLPFVVKALLVFALERTASSGIDRDEKENGVIGLFNSKEFEFEFALDDLPAWIKQWQTSIPVGAEILDLVVSYYINFASASEVFEKTVELLRYVGKNPEAIAKVIPRAIAAVRYCLSVNPDLADELLSLPAIQALKGDAKNSAIFNLLNSLVTGSVKSFLELYATSKGVLGLEGEAAFAPEKVIRFAVLKDISSTKELVSFDDLRNVLLVTSDEELEELLIEGVEEDILDVKINSSLRTVRFLRVSPRKFQPNAWPALKTALNSWKDGLHNINDVRNYQ
eukprot:TRINITY_DN2785_c0_g1_i1.p1 TRINITY_DN2785_c0_g1~~TRINITY_DN2785_c0_g1_i1.p1  ORF type:complete len:404 (+),score=143.24 TRINITY_DN2785_c0_g1_i1:93-1304(+)